MIDTSKLSWFHKKYNYFYKPSVSVCTFILNYKTQEGIEHTAGAACAALKRI